jgi:DNA-binding response OmpR family regulator
MSDDAFTLLVVEDDEATRTFLADNLTADGFDLLVADCAREGLRMIEQKFPDLVLVDVNLPDLSGLDVISQVRGADLAAGRVEAATPMVVLSGRGAELDLLRGFERGADDYLIKPFSYPELRGPISRAAGLADPTRFHVAATGSRDIGGAA